MKAHPLSTLLPAPTRADWAWAIVALAFTLLAVLTVFDAIWDLVDRRELSLGLPLTLWVSWWLIAGAWQRTIWGGRDGLRARAETEER